MTPRLLALYLTALSDAEFCQLFRLLDGALIPGYGEPVLKQSAFAIIYYGYLMEKYNESVKELVAYG